MLNSSHKRGTTVAERIPGRFDLERLRLISIPERFVNQVTASSSRTSPSRCCRFCWSARAIWSPAKSCSPGSGRKRAYGDFDHAVNVAVGKLRTALGDSRRQSFLYRDGAPPRLSLCCPAGGRPGRNAAGASAGRSCRPAHSWYIPAAQAGSWTVCWPSSSAESCLGWESGWDAAPPSRGAPDFQRLTVRHGTVFSARFAPDGHNVVYSASWDGAPIEIFSTDLKIPGRAEHWIPGELSCLRFLPPAKWRCCSRSTPPFMFTFRGTLGQVPLTGGSPRQIAENVDWADWAPDGKTLAIVRDMGGKQRLEFPVGHVLYETDGWISHPRVSPKGGPNRISRPPDP